MNEEIISKKKIKEKKNLLRYWQMKNRACIKLGMNGRLDVVGTRGAGRWVGGPWVLGALLGSKKEMLTYYNTYYAFFCLNIEKNSFRK